MSELLKQPQYCTVEEWLLKEDERSELYDGVIVAMAEPVRRHQEISRELLLQIGTFLRGKACQVFAPWAVRLFEPEDTIVVPDLLVVCDPSKLTDHYVNGAPDLVIEILSPSSERYDRYRKMELYRKAGVREYWLVDDREKVIQIYLLEHDKYIVHAYVYADGDRFIPVSVLPGLTVELDGVFA